MIDIRSVVRNIHNKYRIESEHKASMKKSLFVGQRSDNLMLFYKQTLRVGDGNGGKGQAVNQRRDSGCYN